MLDDALPFADDWRVVDFLQEGFGATLPPLRARLVAPGVAEALLPTGPASANPLGTVHGGYIAATAEQTLFLPLYLAGKVAQGGALTMDFTLQYMAAASPALPLLARVELLRETRRTAFVRGALSQDGQVMVAYTGTLRRFDKPAA
jgi:acyl-coenzyme A thioesterase PaaI-like protein